MFYSNNLCSLCLAHNKNFTLQSTSSAEEMLQLKIPEFVQQTSEMQRKICDDCSGKLTDVRTNCLKTEDNNKQANFYNRESNEEQEENDQKSGFLEIKKEISEEVILDKNLCYLEDDVRTNCLKIVANIKQENSFNRESNEEQEENDQKSGVLGIKKEISEEVILDENIHFHEDDVRTNCLEMDDNIKQENSFNRESNEEQKENDQKRSALEIKKEISEEVILDEDKCFLEDEVRTNFLQINIKQDNSYNMECNEEKEESDQKGDVLDIKKEIGEEIVLDEDTCSLDDRSDTGKTDETENQDVDCDERLKCTECGEKSSNRIRDVDSHKCPKCLTTIAQNKSKQVGFSKKSHPCNTCNKSFSCFSKLKQHERSHTGEKPFSCDLCGKKFTQFFSVKVHQQWVHSNNKPFVCNICHRGFVQVGHLERHKLTHSDKRTFECDVCQKLFKTADALKRHQLIHSGVKRYECDICQKRFSLKSNLTSHIRTHFGERPFQCNLCEKSFARSNVLKLHLETHSSKKPNECAICKKKFRNARYLQMHKLLHTGQVIFKCDICDKKFASSSSLTTHKRIHNNEKPYLCTICQKTFVELSNFNRHKTIHTREKPFACDVCPKKFGQRSALTVHKRIHDGIRPFECGICGKSFRQSSNLKHHEKIHRGENFETA